MTMASSVLPEPVAICTSERGRLSRNDCSRFMIACGLGGQRSSIKGGMCWIRLRKLPLRVAVIGDRANWLWRSVVFHPPEQSFGTVKREDIAAARQRIEPVGGARFRTGGLVAERQMRAPGGNPERHA